MHELDDWKRTIETALEDAGFPDCYIETLLDGENKIVVRVTQNGRTADALPSLVLGAISAAQRDNISLTRAFEIRNMYAPAI